MEEKRYGLLGRHLGHSWSVPIHAALGRRDYALFEVEPEDLEAFLQQKDLGGLNVTMPYKTAVLPFCDALDPLARACGSVNTLLWEGDKLLGYNTDAQGFCAMAERAGIDFLGKKLLILGNGGVSSTVQAMGERLGAREIVVLSRSGPQGYDALPRHADADILVNATPVGMYPEVGESLVDLHQFPVCSGVLDLIYNPRRTALILQAEALSIPCSDGLPMLVAQAVAAEELFYGEPLPEECQERILWDLRWRNTNMVLIGMPGCGKSTVGKILATMTAREAIDLDAKIAEKEGMSVPDILRTKGEEYFRDLEQREAALWGKESGKILMTGGGVVLRPQNLSALRQNGRIYQLDRELSQLSLHGRPLSQDAGLTALWAERESLYWLFRDVLIDNNGAPEAAAQGIWSDFCENSGT